MYQPSPTEVAKYFVQTGDRCLLSSLFYALQMRFVIENELTEGVYQDILEIQSGKGGLENIEKKIAPVSNVNPELLIPLQLCDLINYLAGNGYTLQLHEGKLETLRKNRSNYPLVSLDFQFPDWLNFFGKGNLKEWYKGHVVSMVDIIEDKFYYFEPLTGEIRNIPISAIPKINQIGIVRRDYNTSH
ncbi:MAG: hypothetical protein V1831_03145 [Candidatus Woesearchaeota archaeon]